MLSDKNVDAMRGVSFGRIIVIVAYYYDSHSYYSHSSRRWNAVAVFFVELRQKNFQKTSATATNVRVNRSSFINVLNDA